jgi:hypothetical protein
MRMIRIPPGSTDPYGRTRLSPIHSKRFHEVMAIVFDECYPDTSSKSGVALRERAEQEVDDQRHLGRQPGVLLAPADVSNNRGKGDESERNSRGCSPAHRQLTPTRQPDQRERAYTRFRPVGPPALAPLALDTKQHSNTEHEGERQHGIGHRMLTKLT